MPDATAAVAPIRRKISLPPDKLQLVESAIQCHHALLPPGQPIELALDPIYWAHVAARLKVGDTIHVRPSDGSWFGELIVVGTGPVHADVRLLRHVQLDGAPMAPPRAAPVPKPAA